jgi:phosphatidate cytidylyltransferase
MFHNPLHSSLFLPAMARIGGLLIAGLLLVMLVELRNLRRGRHLRDSVLLRRVATWAVTGPAFVAGVCAGGVVSLVVVLLLMLQGLREFEAVAGIELSYRRVLAGLSVVTVAVAGLAPGALGMLPIAGFMAIAGVAVVRDGGEDAWRQVTASLFGFVYLPLALSSLLLIARGTSAGPAGLLVAGTAVALSDVAAYVVGTLVGGPRLAPRLSPNKTVAGAAGNLLGASLGVAVMGFAIPAAWPTWLVVVLPPLLAGAALFGDLVESLVKRSFAVKDAGTLLPGFGGLLDRIDSLIVALPVAYVAFRLG